MIAEVRVDTVMMSLVLRPSRLAVALNAIVLALIFFPHTVIAQEWSQPWADPEDRPPRVDFSISTGLLIPTRWSDVALLGSLSPAQGALEQVVTRDVRVEPDAQFAAAAIYWRSRYGFRARGGFSRSSLQIGAPGDLTSVGIDTWTYDVGGAIGFQDYYPARLVWPYGFVGVGGITYALKQTIAPPLAFIERDRTSAAPNTTIIVTDPRLVLLTSNALRTESVLALNFGVGTDFRLPLRKAAVALRLEAADHLAASPLTFQVENLSGAAAATSGPRQRLVHHLSATAGIAVQIGR